jgi:arylformamidase
MTVSRDVRAYWEDEYNPRWRIPDSQRYFDTWHARAARARERLGGALDIPYGPHPRERLDLFRAPSPRGTLVFIHGGYWRAFGKEAQSWLAEPFVSAGITVAIPSYPLAPAARLAHIVGSVSRAFAHLHRALLGNEERRRIVVAGHSAGAHLAACLLATGDGSGPHPDAIVCLSGIFDLLPLLRTRMLESMGWQPDELHAVSPLFMPQPRAGTVILAVGGEESWEFHNQSARLARSWGERVTALLQPAGRHHYSILEALEDPSDDLGRAVFAQLEASPA